MRCLLAAALLLFSSCTSSPGSPDTNTATVVTADIDHFWEAFDLVAAEPDSAAQVRILDSLFIQRGTPGLEAMLLRRNLTAADYADAIQRFPRFWASVRPNMGKVDSYADAIDAGIERFRELYPALQPATVYFTVGALRTNGMTLGDVIFIGSELALADTTTVYDEFPETMGHLPGFFATNPLASVDFLNVHEYVHTQQSAFGQDLLTMALQEGVAEYVAVLATGQPSPAPAVAFGQANVDAVRDAFALEMFGSNTRRWMWSNARNQFNVRDLGYYVGYAIAEGYHTQADDPAQALAELIEVDYTDPDAIDALVTASGYFDRPVAELRAEAPRVVGLDGLQNGARNLEPGLHTFTITFSHPMNPRYSGFDYGPLGAEGALRIQRVVERGEDGSITIEVNLEPNRRHQMMVSSNFRTQDGASLVPYLIDVSTRAAE